MRRIGQNEPDQVTSRHISKRPPARVAFVNSSAGRTPARSHHRRIGTCQYHRLFRGCSEVRQSESYEPAFGNHSTSDHLLSIVEDTNNVGQSGRLAKRQSQICFRAASRAPASTGRAFCQFPIAPRINAASISFSCSAGLRSGHRQRSDRPASRYRPARRIRPRQSCAGSGA